jgi:V8-like Glu-specific endopeptidase
MKTRTIAAIFIAALAALITAACGAKSDSAANEKAIKSTKSGDLTVTLASATGELKSGDNDLILSFADATGKTVDVGAASLRFHMPAMGSMAEMNDAATLTTTDAPGKYRAKVNIEVGGTWEAIVNYEGPKGTGRASMTVNAK